MILRRAALFACLLILASSAGFCDNATMGRYGPQQMSFTPEKLGPPLILNWEFASSRNHDNPAAPIVEGNVCYFSSGDRVFALDIESGTQKWRYPLDVALTSMIKATPTVVDGKVYFGTGDGKLYCVNAEDGKFEWFFETRGAVRCPPIVQDGVMYFGADDNSIYALNASTGDTFWTKPFQARDDFGNGIALGAGMVVGSCMDGNLYGVNATGKQRWGFRLPNAPVKTSPIMTENLTIMAVGTAMYGITTRSGQSKWFVQLPSEVAATPATDGFDVFVPCRNKKLYCYNISGRQPALKWTEPADIGGIPFSSPTIAGDMVYVTGSHGIVAGFSVADGSLKWRYVFGTSTVTAPGTQFTDAACSPTVANGNLLVLTDDGVLHCFTKTAPDTSAPEVFYTTPTNGVKMSGAPPIKLSATLYDIGSGVDLGDGRGNGSGGVTMMLDGEPVELTVDLATGTVTHTTDVGDPLKTVVTALKDGVHVVTLTAKDYAGNQVTKEWCFTADSTMPPPRRIKAATPVGKKTKDPGGRSPGSYPGAPMGPGSGETMSPPPPPPPPGPGGPGDNQGGYYRRGGGRRGSRGSDQSPPDGTNQ